MPNDHIQGLPNNYWEVNQYFTEAVYKDGHRDFNQDRTEAIIRMTFTEKRAAENLPNPKSKGAEICILNVQSGFRRAEARSYPGEYDHLLPNLGVGFGSMIYCPRMMQLATIVPLSNGHQQVTHGNWEIWLCQERKLTWMPKDKMRLKWWSTFPHITPVNSDDSLCRESNVRHEGWITVRLQIRAESPIDSNSNLEIDVTLLPSPNGNLQSTGWRSCRQSNEFSRREIADSTRSSPTDNSKPTVRQLTKTCTGKLIEMTTSIKIAFMPPVRRAHPWSRLDGHWCRLSMTITKSGRISQSMALTDGNWQRNITPSTARRLGRAQVHLNLLNITILEKYIYQMWTNELRLHTMQLTYTSDDYWWQWTMPAAEAPIDAQLWAEALPPW